MASETELSSFRLHVRDTTSFQQFYQMYADRLYQYIAYRVEQPTDVEDLTAEVFLRVIKNQHQFRGSQETSLTAWVFKIAHNIVNDFYRRNEASTMEWETLSQVEDSAPPLESAVLHQENKRELHRLIAELPERPREVIVLRFFSGLRNREIAVVLGIDERTVASHLSRGLKALYDRYQYKEGYYESELERR